MVYPNQYREFFAAVGLISAAWSNMATTRRLRREYVTLRMQTIFVQQKWRAKKESEVAREEYQRIKRATLVIQKSFRRGRRRG